jgi:hypothetical protein
MRRWRAGLAAVAAALALAYLAAMVVTGAPPVQRQRVPFEAKGLLTLPPERITRVMLARGDASVMVRRTGDRSWSRVDGAGLAGDAGARLSTAVEMMHRSGPVRRLEPAELADVDKAPYGLDPPQIVVTLFADGSSPALLARFGGRNPDGFLQYVQIAGDPRIYLMSRFIGEEWRQAIEAVGP